MNVLILGVNGFIGHHLTRRILSTTGWNIHGMDMHTDRVEEFMGDRRFHFFEGDIAINREWIEYHLKKCDVVLPLVAIATPADYVTRPLDVFELDFEANLPIVRACVKRRKRLVFPSTSEVYGMCPDEEFDADMSNLVLGPIKKQRWIYSCSKQLMDRVIWAYGSSSELDFTLFRPFNWVGPGLDNLHAAKEGSSRVVTQFLGHIARSENIRLVDGGAQRRSFTDIEDAIIALMTIIENPHGVTSGKIYNIGNPGNNLSIRELATMMLRLANEFPEWAERASHVKMVDVSADTYYGTGYQDMLNRRPRIDTTCRDLNWRPSIKLEQTLRGLFEFYRAQLTHARGLIDEGTGDALAPAH
jgi:nucleoside-diphosphate-sugar epimerase